MNRKQHQRRSQSLGAASGHGDHKRVSRELKRHQGTPKRFKSASAPQDRGVRKSYCDWSGTITGSGRKSGKKKRESCKQGPHKNCQKRQQQAHHSCLVFVGHYFRRYDLGMPRIFSSRMLSADESALLINRRFRVPANAQQTDDDSA